MSEKQSQEPKGKIDLSRLVTPSEKKSLPHVPEETAQEIRFEHLGGEKLLHHVPEKTETEIDFSHVGGKRVLDSNHPSNVKPDVPAESVDEKEEDERDTD